MDPPKKVPLLPAPAKVKEETKTYFFELKLGESNDRTYPEFSWKDLIRDNDSKKVIENKPTTGMPALDPYASDDEDALKAMAAKFEQKYNNTASSSDKVRKRKRQAEDYIDRGAGYDETDSFIDNTDIYDEVVPEDLQTVHGGFYINSGALEYKEAEVSEGELEETKSDSSVKRKKVITKSFKPPQLTPEATTVISNTTVTVATIKGPPKNTSDSFDDSKKRKDVSQIKNRRKSVTDNTKKVKSDVVNTIKPKLGLESIPPPKEKNHSMVIISSSSSSSESSSSEEDSSNSSSGSDSSEHDVTKKNELIKATIFRKNATMMPKPIPLNPERRLKVKNVPLNPKLHGNLTTVAPSTPPINNRDIFTSPSTSSGVKGINSLPLGLTVTANVGPPKLSPSIGIGTRADIKPSSGTNTIISAPKKTKTTKLNSLVNMNLTSPVSTKARKPKPSSIQQQLTAHQHAMASINQAKFGIHPYENFQLQQAGNLTVLPGLNLPFTPEVKKKNRSSRNNNKFPTGTAATFGGTMNQLGTTITMTDVKDRKSSLGNMGSFNNKSLNISMNRKSGSPVNTNISRLPTAITITPSPPTLNLSTSSSGMAHHSKNNPLGSSLNMTPTYSKNFKYQVTPHDVNSLLNKKDSPKANSSFSNINSSIVEKIFGNGVSSVKDSQRK